MLSILLPLVVALGLTILISEMFREKFNGMLTAVAVAISAFVLYKHFNIAVPVTIGFLALGCAIWVGIALMRTNIAANLFRDVYKLIDQMAYAQGYDDARHGRPLRVLYQAEAIVAEAMSVGDLDARFDKKRMKYLWSLYQSGYNDAQDDRPAKRNVPTDKERQAAFGTLHAVVDKIKESLGDTTV